MRKRVIGVNPAKPGTDKPAVRKVGICPDCGHDWYNEVRTYADCPTCHGYRHQAKMAGLIPFI